MESCGTRLMVPSGELHNYRRSFSNKIRNIRSGLSMDGMNPFNMVSSNHSTWLVSLCIYNLPPWLCMKWTYLMMSILIQGPRQPRNDIDVFLESLMEELLKLWMKGERVWDEYKKEHFKLKSITICNNHRPTSPWFIIWTSDKGLQMMRGLLGWLFR
jgi:hypothetical protein